MTGLSVPATRFAGLTAGRSLLVYGVVAGPLFVVAVLLQAVTRDGFDLRRHPLSLLSLGEWGWVQIANFVAAGLLYLAGAVGMRRTMTAGRARTWGPRLIGGFGITLIWAGIFATDPAEGFPPGTPDGIGRLSWHGLLHSIGPAAAFLILAAACVVFARRFIATGRKGWAAYSIATALALFTPDLFATTRWFTLALYTALVLGWGWASAVTAAMLAEATGTPHRP